MRLPLHWRRGVRCPACAAMNAATARFCDQCGSPLTTAQVPMRRVGDRRIVSALFADIVDYSTMVAEAEPEEVQRRIDSALRAMDEAIRRFGGAREKFIGDAIFAVFGHPRAHDDDALRAGLCALAIRAALSEPRQAGSAPLQVRIGIATGEVVAADREVPGTADVAFTGPVVVTAARIQGLARPGEIILDDSTVRSMRGRLVIEPRGSELIRGQAAPVALFALRGEHGLVPPAPRTGGRRLVGRTAERARLREALDAMLHTGSGGTIIVRGEAGIGKTRLLADLEVDATAAGVAWTWTENVSYGVEEPYRFARAFAQAVANEHGTDSGSMSRRLLFQPDLDPAVLRRMAGAIAAMARDAEFSGWEAEARWTPADPSEVSAALTDVARRYIERLVETSGPRVIVVDDLQWIDRSSSGLLDEIVRASRRLPILVLITTRPGELPASAGSDDIDLLDLIGLDAVETGQLAADLAGSDLQPDDARFVHGRTGGNPLFVTETIRALLDDGLLAIRDGRLTIVEPSTAHKVPISLRAVLGARFDALGTDARESLDVASVVGETFAGDLVAELVGRPVDAALDRLAEAALVIPVDRGSVWRFGHVLIRDAAYAGLLANRRRMLHARLADALERDPEATPALLARHRLAAGQNDRAVPQLVAAADAAIALGAIDEAMAALRLAGDLEEDGGQADAYRRRADALAPLEVGSGG
jgi:class 3 adenylate cyclase